MYQVTFQSSNESIIYIVNAQSANEALALATNQLPKSFIIFGNEVEKLDATKTVICEVKYYN